MATDLAAVEPHRGPIVDRLKADDPAPVGSRHVPRERVARQGEVAPVPLDPAIAARLAEVPGVVGARNGDRGPAVGRESGCATGPARSRRRSGRGAPARCRRAGTGWSARRDRARPRPAAARCTPGPAPRQERRVSPRARVPRRALRATASPGRSSGRGLSPSPGRRLRLRLGLRRVDDDHPPQHLGHVAGAVADGHGERVVPGSGVPVREAVVVAGACPAGPRPSSPSPRRAPTRPRTARAARCRCH